MVFADDTLDGAVDQLDRGDFVERQLLLYHVFFAQHEGFDHTDDLVELLLQLVGHLFFAVDHEDEAMNARQLRLRGG